MRVPRTAVASICLAASLAALPGCAGDWAGQQDSTYGPLRDTDPATQAAKEERRAEEAEAQRDAASELAGTWYAFDGDGEETSLTFSADGTGYDNLGVAFTWKDRGDSVEVTHAGLFVAVYAKGDGALTYTPSDGGEGMVYCRDREEARQEAERLAGQRADAEAEARDAFLEATRAALVGTWEYSADLSEAPEGCHDGATLVVREDGSWSWDGSWHVPAIVAGKYLDGEIHTSGTWEVVYDGPEEGAFDSYYVSVRLDFDGLAPLASGPRVGNPGFGVYAAKDGTPVITKITGLEKVE